MAPRRFLLLGSLLTACSGVIAGPGATPMDDPGSPIPDAELCADVSPHLALPMRRMDPEEYAAVASALVGREIGSELVAPEQLAAQGGGLRNEVAAGVTTTAVEAMIADAGTLAAALLTSEVAVRYAECMSSPAPDLACAETFIGALASAAFRRPVPASELTELMGTYHADPAAGDALELTVKRVLLHPETFYRPELGGGEGELRTLTPHELASRLSFTLTGQPPSDALRAAAEAGELADPESRREWAERLVFDGDTTREEARLHLRKLFFDWLQLADLERLQGPESAPDLPERWRDETMAFVEEVVFNRREGLESLLDGGFAMLDRTLATAYGDDAEVSEDTLRAVPSERRRGLLQQGSFLARTWAEGRTPIHRGVYVLRRFFCAEPGEAPEEAMDFVAPAMGSERERLAPLETDESCASCHAAINPIGYAFLGFGEHGETRGQDFFDEAIDASGFVPSIDTHVVDSSGLSAAMADEDAVKACMSQWVFTFASGRRLDRGVPEDACRLRELSEQPSTIGQLFDYVASDAFTHNRIPTGDSE